MIADQHMPTILHSSSSFVLYWMRDRSLKDDIVTSLRSSNRILIPYIPLDDKQPLPYFGSPYSMAHPTAVAKLNFSNEGLGYGGDDNSPSSARATHHTVNQNIKKSTKANLISHGRHNANLGKSSYDNDFYKNTKDKKSDLYKTEMCRNWQEIGHCRYGKKCRYAHGEDELRAVKRHQRYKTEVCRTYHETGACPYGVRCTFIHDEKSSANPKIVFCDGKALRTDKGKHTDLQTFVDAPKTMPPSPELSIGSSGSSTVLLVDPLACSFEGIFDEDYKAQPESNQVTNGSVIHSQDQDSMEPPRIIWADSTITRLESRSQPSVQYFMNNERPDESRHMVPSEPSQLPRTRSMDNIAPRLCDYFSKLGTEETHPLKGKSFIKNSSKEAVAKRISTRVASTNTFSWQT